MSLKVGKIYYYLHKTEHIVFRVKEAEDTYVFIDVIRGADFLNANREVYHQSLLWNRSREISKSVADKIEVLLGYSS